MIWPNFFYRVILTGGLTSSLLCKYLSKRISLMPLSKTTYMRPHHFVTAVVICLLFSFCGSSKKIYTETGSGSTKVSTELLDNRTFKLTEVSTDETYGYSEKNAIMVGGVREESGALNQQRFLNALLGPNGEKVTYQRLGSCCPVKSQNAFVGEYGLLDRYEVTYAGLEKPIVLYLNFYDPGPLKAPKGFTFRQ